MRYILMMLLLFSIGASAQIQVDSLIVKQKIKLNGYRIYGVSNDTAVANQDSSKLITEKAAKNLASTKVQYIDTAPTLAAYQTALNARLRYTDTVALLAAYRTALNCRLKYTDTTAMLAAYLNALVQRVSYSDTSSMLAAYRAALLARMKYTDSSGMLSAYQTAINARLKITDTAGMLAACQTALNARQVTLVSGTNIKTVNGSSILGSGNLTVSGGITSIVFGRGLTGGTVTSTGSVGLDTTGSYTWTSAQLYSSTINGITVSGNYLGNNNIAIGKQVAIGGFGTGTDNIAIGNLALNSSTINGQGNIGVGSQSLKAIIASAQQNTAVGLYAGYGITTGSYNTVVGSQTGFTGNFSNSVLIGSLTGYSNPASNAVSIGYNIPNMGANGVSIGTSAGYNVSGAFNISIGNNAAQNVTTGTYNICIGSSTAGYAIGNYNTIIGNNVAVTSAISNNVILGDGQGNHRLNIFSNNNISIGYGNNPSDDGINKLQLNGSIKSTQYRLSSLNTAPISSSDTGTAGEIRITSGYIYICTATNTWVRSSLSTF